MYKSLLRERRAKGKSQDSDALQYKEDGQGYAICLQLLGNGRIKVFCDDEQERIAKICGRMRKFNRQLIERGDTVLVSYRDFQDKKADCIHKYSDDDARFLEKIGELPESLAKRRQVDVFGCAVGQQAGEEDDTVEFAQLNVDSI